MLGQFLRNSSRCLGTNLLQPTTTKLMSAANLQTGSVRFLRFDSPKFPTRFLRKPVLPTSSRRTSEQTVAEEYTEVAAEDLEKTEEVLDLVNDQIESGSYGRLFAVVMLGWHQHKVTSGDILMVNHDIGAKPGQRIKLDKVLLIGSKDFTLMGRPLLPKDLHLVEATVVEKNLSQTKICQKFRKRQQYLRHFFHREYQTTLRINQIDVVRKVDETTDRSGFEPPSNKDPLCFY